MEINDTIQTLFRIRQSLEKGVPQTTRSPDDLITHLNELYVASTENDDFDDLFEYDDVGSPSITLIVGVEVEFDLRRVMKTVRARLNIEQPTRADEIGTAGIVWSHGRYDFVFGVESGSLRISHGYSHKRVDTKSVSSIAKRMIDFAMAYLEEVKAATAGSPDRAET